MSTAVLEDTSGRDRVARVEELLAEVERLDGPARETATAIAQALLELYGEGLERIVGAVAEHDDGALAEAFAADELIAHLLLVHDLHPLGLEERVRQALDTVGPYLASHGGGVELVGLDGGVVRLRLQGSCNGCPSSTATLKLAIEEAIHTSAPEVEAIEAEGVQPPAPPGPALIQLEMAPGAGAAPPPPAEPAWSLVGRMPEVPSGAPVVKQVAGTPVLFVALGGDPYAYRSTCPGCGRTLEDAALLDGALSCAGCDRRYEVRRAGRCQQDADLRLEPVPLLADESGLVKVALGAVA